MRRILELTAGAIIGMLLFGSYAAAGTSGQGGLQLSFNDISDYNPKINNNGDIVWQSKVNDANYQILLRNNGDNIATQITDSETDNWYPEINDAGEVAWLYQDGTDFEVMLYSNDIISQLSDNTVLDYWLQLNNIGELVWGSWMGDWEVFQYSSGLTEQITDNQINDKYPKINDFGNIIWQQNTKKIAGSSKDDPSGNEIVLKTSSGISQITDDEDNDHIPVLNNNGDMAWEFNDGNDCEIVQQMAGSSLPIQITDNQLDDWYPKMNNDGDIAWQQGINGEIDFEIVALLDNTVVQITNNEYNDIMPVINENGDIAWIEHGETIRVMLYKAGTGEVLAVGETFQGHYNTTPSLNDNGEVVWHGWDGSDWEIVMAASSDALEDDLHFYPHTLNMNSNGRKFTAYIELSNLKGPVPTIPAEEIDPESIRISAVNTNLLETELAPTGKFEVGDFDKNGITDLMIKFDRREIIDMIRSYISTFPSSVDLSIGGNLFDGKAFTGVDSVQVLDKKITKKGGKKIKKQSKQEKSKK